MKCTVLTKSRKPLRLPRFNYKSAGYYFITFCVEKRFCLLGNVINGRLNLNAAGHMVSQEINTLQNRYFDIDVDTFVVMPNHVHAVIVISGRTRRSAPSDCSLSDVVKNIKTFTTTQYIQGVHQKNWQPFYKRLWQRNFYECIIRNQKHLDNVRRYIVNNPMNWANMNR